MGLSLAPIARSFPHLEPDAHPQGPHGPTGQPRICASVASFILGQEPFRTGLLTIGMPGDPHGITHWMPTIADVLKTQGYATSQFGKNHLGDHDDHLPTNHGFDEFFGNLYHLNAEEEPEGYFYPKDPEFRKQYGPRGVLHTFADGKGGQKIEDTGPLNTTRMPTIDEEFLGAAKKFIELSVRQNTPFFVWFNTRRSRCTWTATTSCPTSRARRRADPATLLLRPGRQPERHPLE